MQNKRALFTTAIVNAAPEPTDWHALYLAEQRARQEAEAHLQHLNNVLTGLGDGLVVLDSDLRYRYANPLTLELMGRTEEEVLGRYLFDLYPDLKGTAYAAGMETALRERRQVETDLFYPRNSRWWRTFINPTESGLTIYYRDVTDLRATEALEQRLAALRKDFEDERRYVMAGANCLLWHANVEERGNPDRLHWDIGIPDIEAAQRFLPLTVQPEEVYQDAWYRCRLPEDRAACDRLGTAAVRSSHGYRHEFRIQRRDGSVRWLNEDVHVETVEPGKRWRAIAVCTDITERKLVETAVRESEAQYRRLADSMPQIVWTARPDGALDYYNARWFEFTGFTEEESYAREGWAPILHPDDRERCREAWYGCVQSGEPYQIEYRFIDHAAGGYRWFLGRAVPVKDAEGRVLKWFGSCTDIDDQKRAQIEIAALNARLRRSVQETHHRVKNNLQIISALTELQMEQNQVTVPAAALVRIGQHTRSLAAVHDLLTQEAKNNTQADTLSTQTALNRLIPLLQTTAGGRRIRYTVEETRLPIREIGSLCLLVNELVSNAVKHGRSDVEVLFRVCGSTAHLEVGDDGPGFPPGFDPEIAGNTGLGLIDSAGRYDLGGTITYENRPEGGARVRVVFPLPDACPE